MSLLLLNNENIKVPFHRSIFTENPEISHIMCIASSDGVF